MIEPANDRDLAAVRALLQQVGLPLDGVEALLDTTLVAREAGEVVGSAALELYGDGALLRSVAVNPRRQGSGLGHALTEAALRLAESRQAGAVFLLTTTAAHFFPRFGFTPIAREEVPASVQMSVEFRSACPASAIVMRKPLRSTVDPG